MERILTVVIVTIDFIIKLSEEKTVTRHNCQNSTHEAIKMHSTNVF